MTAPEKEGGGMKTIFVKAAKGMRCPKEGRPREYVTDAETVEVPATAYYKRLLTDGSLVSAVEKKTKTYERKKEE